MATRAKATGGLVKNQGKPAKKAAAKPADEPTGRRRRELDVEAIVSMKDEDGLKWKEIAESMETTVGSVIFAYEKSKLKKSEKVKFDPDDEKGMGKLIVGMREQDKLSWGRISMRFDISEARARKLYADYAKDPSRGERIGKGGRHAGGEATVTNIASKRKADPEKVAAAKKGARAKGAEAAEAATRRPGRRRGAEAAADETPAKRKPGRKKAEAAAE